MATLSRIEASGFAFDALVEGPADGPLVLLLHGFAESLHTWRGQLPVLAAAGFRAVAPSQRGYSPTARPDAADPQNYHFDKLVADAVAIADASRNGKRFHLVGHDWGGSIAWGIADKSPERLASLTILSRPHPNAFNRALELPDGEQKHRSRHHRAFLEPDAAKVVLADDARWLRERWNASGMPAAAQAEHLSVLGNPKAHGRRRSPGTARAARSAPRSA